MTNQPANVNEPAAYNDSYIDSEAGPGFLDAIRFLYQRRVRLLFYFLATFLLGALVAFFLVHFSPKSVEGTLGIGFRGIEKGEYPSGKRFNVEDFRSPGLLVEALPDTSIGKDRVPLQELAAHISISAVIPGEIRSRWVAQEKAGTKKDEYYPSEFKINISLGNLTTSEKLRLFDAIVKHYRERVKYDRDSALAFASSPDTSYEKLANSYDPWDIPDLFRQSSRSLDEKLTKLIEESLLYQDARYHLAFRELARDLDTWNRTRLQALEALTYQGHLVRNRDFVMQRLQYQIQDLDVRIKQQNQEANEAIRLLEVIDRPNALLTGKLTNKDGIPIVDTTALDKLIKNDYVAPVVDRVSDLQDSIQKLALEKARLENQLSWISRTPTTASLQSGHKELIGSVSTELNSIFTRYNRLLDEYLNATITSLVIVRQPALPVSQYSYMTILIGWFFVSIVLALFGIGGERLLERVRERGQSQ